MDLMPSLSVSGRSRAGNAHLPRGPVPPSMGQAPAFVTAIAPLADPVADLIHDATPAVRRLNSPVHLVP